MRPNGGQPGNKIANLRKIRGFTQAELADSAGISIRTVQRIEANRVEPYDDTLKKIAAALGVKVKELKKVDTPVKKLIIIHLSPLSGLVLPMFQLVAPIVLWLFYRNDYSDIGQQVKEILIFHGMTTLFFAAGLLFVLFGFSAGYVMAFGTILFCTSLTLWNAYKLSGNKKTYYPLIINRT